MARTVKLVKAATLVPGDMTTDGMVEEVKPGSPGYIHLRIETWPGWAYWREVREDAYLSKVEAS